MKFRFEIVLAFFVLAIAAMLLVPLPTVLIDILIVLNLAFSFLILLVSLYLPNALSLLSFPTLLLLSTLFRLALNVASSRLILSQGDAGVVIEAFGTLLVGGQLAVGIIIFTIITVVNFLVIARGSARVSEVAARFALDAMPGKQATIDSDMRAGLISGTEATRRREALRKESQLYGAMDGSMKFVQGDAIAGFLIILTNIIGGLSIAVGDGMPFKEAFQTYTILTVGDGLVAQVPALLVAICAGIVVTRVSSTDTATLGEDVAADLFARPGIVVMVGILLAALALLPGVPVAPFLAVSAVLVVLGYRLRFTQRLLAAANAAGTRAAPLDNRRLSGIGMGKAGISAGAAGLLSPPLGTSSADRRLLGLTSTGVRTGVGNVADDGGHARVRILLDRHALFASFEREFSSSYARWQEIANAVESHFGVKFPEIWIGSDVRAATGNISVELDRITVHSTQVPLDATVVVLEPSHARALGLTVIVECLDPLTGKALSWIGNESASHIEPFARLDAIDLSMRCAAAYLLSHPEELITIADTHAALTELEKDHPGLFDSSLDRRFINPARATEIKRELLRAGVPVGDTRQLIEDLAHYCATYAKSELTASDFDLSDIVMHIRRLRLRQIAGSLNSGRSGPAATAAVRVGPPASGYTATIEGAQRDLTIAIRSGSRPVCGVIDEGSFVAESRSYSCQFPHVTWVAETEIRAPEFSAARVAFVGERLVGASRSNA